MNQKTEKVLIITGIIFLILVLGSSAGYFFWSMQNKQLKNQNLSENKIIEKPSNPNILKAYYLQDGNLWFLNNAEKKLILDIEDSISAYDLYSNNIYWTTPEGELYKKDTEGNTICLISLENDIEKITVNEEKYHFDYYKGAVGNFTISPDGEYIVYQQTIDLSKPIVWEKYPEKIIYNYVFSLNIMKNDGTFKTPIAMPANYSGSMAFLRFEENNNIIFNINGGTSFKVGIDGKNPEILPAMGWTVGDFAEAQVILDSKNNEGIITISDHPIVVGYFEQEHIIYFITDHNDGYHLWSIDVNTNNIEEILNNFNQLEVVGYTI